MRLFSCLKHKEIHVTLVGEVVEIRIVVQMGLITYASNILLTFSGEMLFSLHTTYIEEIYKISHNIRGM